MVTAAEIMSINTQSDPNDCEVRIPIFESVGTPKGYTYKALILIQPGHYNCYKTGDKVWVIFKEFHFTKPVIIGKIFNKNTKDEELIGQFDIDSLTVGSKAKLPITTALNVENSAYVDFREYDTILKCIQALKKHKEILEKQSKLLESSQNSTNLWQSSANSNFNSLQEQIGKLQTENKELRDKVYSLEERIAALENPSTKNTTT